jgi:hypothetical protein
MDDVERLLLEAERLEPQRDVRARVLGAATPLVQPDRSRLDRIWFSHACRMSAVLALLALIGVDMVSGRLVSATPGVQERLVSDFAHAVMRAALDMGLTPADAAELAAQAMVLPPPPRVSEDPDSPF